MSLFAPYLVYFGAPLKGQMPVQVLIMNLKGQQRPRVLHDAQLHPGVDPRGGRFG